MALRKSHPVQEPQFVRKLFSSIATRYDLANHLLSGGLDYYWRYRAGRLVASWAPHRVLDLATGSGDLALTLRSHCPKAEIVGADFCHPMLLQAQAKGVGNLVVADGTRLPFADETFDVVTVAFGLRNMESWSGALKQMHRVLRSGGHLLVLDFSMPPAPLSAPYRFYLHHLLPAVAGLLTGEKGAYQYLGESIERFPAGSKMRALFEENGFVEATSRRLSGGIVSLYTGKR